MYFLKMGQRKAETLGQWIVLLLRVPRGSMKVIKKVPFPNFLARENGEGGRGSY